MRQRQDIQQQLSGIRRLLSQPAPAPSASRRRRGSWLSSLATLAMLGVLALIVIDLWPRAAPTFSPVSAAPLPTWTQALPLPTGSGVVQTGGETAVLAPIALPSPETAAPSMSSPAVAPTQDPAYRPAYSQGGITYYVEATPQGDEALFVLEDGQYSLYAYQRTDGTVAFEEEGVVYEMATDGSVSQSRTSSEALQGWYVGASPAQQQELHAPVPTTAPQPTPNPTITHHNEAVMATPAASGRRGGGSSCAGLSRSACVNQARGTQTP